MEEKEREENSRVNQDMHKGRMVFRRMRHRVERLYRYSIVLIE